jgi:hypothetical protein
VRLRRACNRGDQRTVVHRATAGELQDLVQLDDPPGSATVAGQSRPAALGEDPVVQRLEARGIGGLWQSASLGAEAMTSRVQRPSIAFQSGEHAATMAKQGLETAQHGAGEEPGRHLACRAGDEPGPPTCGSTAKPMRPTTSPSSDHGNRGRTSSTTATLRVLGGSSVTATMREPGARVHGPIWRSRSPESAG